MAQEPQWQPGGSVEFVGDPGDFASPTGYGVRRQRRQATVRLPSWFSFALSGVMSVGAVITVVSVSATQLIFHPGAANARVTYALNGLGHFHLVGQGSSRFSLGGHAPALGAIAIAGAVVLIVAATVRLLPTRTPLVSALNAGVACFAAGVIVAVLACEAVEGTGFARHTWAAGFWLLVVGASLAASAALTTAAHAAATRPENRTQPPT